jgi:hypothetical protein
MHAALHSSQSNAAIALTCEPKYLTAEILDIIMQKHALLNTNKIIHLYIFDGVQNVMKHLR